MKIFTTYKLVSKKQMCNNFSKSKSTGYPHSIPQWAGLQEALREGIYIQSLRHYLACRGMKSMMNFFFQRRGRRLRLDRPTGGQGKKESPTKEKEVIKGFSFLYSSQISCLRRQIHFFTQLPHVQPCDLEWLTYFNIPLILNLWKFPGIPLKIELNI